MTTCKIFIKTVPKLRDPELPKQYKLKHNKQVKVHRNKDVCVKELFTLIQV